MTPEQVPFERLREPGELCFSPVFGNKVLTKAASSAGDEARTWRRECSPMGALSPPNLHVQELRRLATATRARMQSRGFGTSLAALKYQRSRNSLVLPNAELPNRCHSPLGDEWAHQLIPC